MPGSEVRMGLKAKDRKVVELEFLPHMDSLYRYALMLTRNADEAEELTQETLLRGMDNLSQYTPGTNARAWLCRIMSTQHLNRVKRHHRKLEIPMEELPESQAGEAREPGFRTEPELAFLKNLAGAEISRAVESLPQDFRQMIVLADLEGLSYKEIADILSCPMGTVMSRLFRARKLLRRKLHRLGQEMGLVKEGARGGDNPGEFLADLASYRSSRGLSNG
jgi:RNA polymerase sigma-70 factor (ECF subfamily)